MRLFVITLLGCWQMNLYAQPAKKLQRVQPTVQAAVWQLTQVMFHDVVNPPAASRFYAYALLAGYEALCQLDGQAPRMQHLFKQYPAVQTGMAPQVVHKELTVLFSILETGRLMLPSGYLLDTSETQLLTWYRGHGLGKPKLDSSVRMAQRVAQQIVQYAKADGYFALSTRPRYKPLGGEDHWRPTPPEYMTAVEPHWRTIRPFYLDSATQFAPLPALPFDTAQHSGFMQLAKEVYQTTQAVTTEQNLIANFWDCNPFAVQFEGHMSIGLKKISPGGHWMGITGIAAAKAKLGFTQNLLLHTAVALSLHDAFVSCWTEKYRSNRVRPESVINRYLDAKWKPLLQTPPFPEYTSGHSVASTVSAELLTHFLGEGFAYVDSVETYIGLQPRRFASFRQAAAEACISRLYGGIHFRDAIENGSVQGQQLAKYIIGKIGVPPFKK